jgi:hypothetical protein
MHKIVSAIKQKDKENYELVLLGISFLTAIFYALCCTPSIGWRDGPELVVTATYLDVAHPAGFPTYNILAKIMTWLPFGSLGFRLSLFSSLAGGLTVYVSGLLLWKLHSLEKKSRAASLWLLVGLPWLVLHQGVYAASVEVEVYSLNILFVVGLLYCATNWHEGQGQTWLYFGGLLYGLACGNHASLALYLPMLLLLTFWGEPKKAQSSEPSHFRLVRISILALVFLIGLSVYFLLLVRSKTGVLPVDFGWTNNLERFWYHISDAKDREYHTKSLLNINQLLFYLKLQFDKLASPFFWTAIPFMLWGVKYLWDKYQILSVALAVLLTINMVFFFYWIDGVAAFLPAVLVFFLLVSLGLGQFGRLLERLKLPAAIQAALAVCLVAAALAGSGTARYSERENEAGFQSVELLWPDLSNLPPESLVIHGNNWFSELAFQHIYMARPDVTMLGSPAALGMTYVSPPTPEKFPMAVFPRSSNGLPIPAYGNPQFAAFFIDANMEAGKPVYFQYCLENVSFMAYSTPDPKFRWLARMKKSSAASAEAFRNGDYERYFAWFTKFIDELANSKDPPLARKAPASIYYIVQPILDFLMQEGDYSLAESVIRRFMATFSDDNNRLMTPFDVELNALAFLADSLTKQKRFAEAEEVLATLVSLDPSKPDGRYLQASNFDSQGQAQKALEAIDEALEFSPYELEYVRTKAQILAKYWTIQDGVSFLYEKSENLTAEGLPFLSKIVDYYRRCLLQPPEADADEHVYRPVGLVETLNIPEQL